MHLRRPPPCKCEIRITPGMEYRAGSLWLDASLFDDRPPFLNLSLLQRADCFGRLLLWRRRLASRSLILRRMPGSANAPVTALLSLATTSFGVPLGAKMAFQFEKVNPESPASWAVGISGIGGKRCGAVTASALTVPART